MGGSASVAPDASAHLPSGSSKQIVTSVRSHQVVHRNKPVKGNTRQCDGFSMEPDPASDSRNNGSEPGNPTNRGVKPTPSKPVVVTQKQLQTQGMPLRKAPRGLQADGSQTLVVAPAVGVRQPARADRLYFVESAPFESKLPYARTGDRLLRSAMQAPVSQRRRLQQAAALDALEDEIYESVGLQNMR